MYCFLLIISDQIIMYILNNYINRLRYTFMQKCWPKLPAYLEFALCNPSGRCMGAPHKVEYVYPAVLNNKTDLVALVYCFTHGRLL